MKATKPLLYLQQSTLGKQMSQDEGNECHHNLEKGNEGTNLVSLQILDATKATHKAQGKRLMFVETKIKKNTNQSIS